MYSPRGAWLTVLSWAALTPALCAQTPPRQDSPEQKSPLLRSEAQPQGIPNKTLDELGIPPNSVILIYDDPQKAMNALPRGVLLAPEKYQELRRLELEQAQRQANLIKLTVPTSCRLSGNIEGDLARIQAKFQIITDRPRVPVFLGCQRSWTRSATLNGHLPLLASDPKDEGLFVHVEKPGTHVLHLELVAPVVGRGTKGNERGFDLGLPRCAITILESFRIPGELSDVRLNRQAERPRMEAAQSRLDNILLGAADRLDLSWKSLAPNPSQELALTSSEGRWTARVEGNRIVTEVELQLQVLRGEVGHWRIQIPRGLPLDLREPGPEDEQIDRRDLPTEQSSVLTLHLKKPSAEPMRVVFQVQQPRRETENPIGPFVVEGALRQSGVIGVVAPPEFRLNYRTEGNTTQRDVADDSTRNLAASFSYWSLLASAKQGGPVAPLYLDVQPLSGAVEARVEHTLELTPVGWHAQTKMDFYPIRTGVDTIEIQVPDNYPFDSARGVGPSELADPPVLDLKRRLATIKLARKQTRPFSLTLTANYTVPAGQQQITMELPKPQRALDKGCRTVMLLPADWELITRAGEAESTPPGSGRSHQYSRAWERTPDRVELAWRPYRPELRTEALIDATIYASHAAVKQRLEVQFPGRTTQRVALSIPAPLANRVRLVRGGILEVDGQVKLERAEGKATLHLEYDVPLAGKPGIARPPGLPLGDRLAPFPIVQVQQATQAQTRARFWCDPTQTLSIGAGPWDEAALETVPERSSLPALVLRSTSLDTTLTLLLRDNVPATTAPFVIERALVQAMATTGGRHLYRARFRVAHIGAQDLDVELPGPVAALNLAVYLDGKRINAMRIVDAGGNPSENGTIARLTVAPELYHQSVILDVRYQWGPPRRSGETALASTFVPPLLPAAVLLGPVRWQLDLPSGLVYLYRGESYDTEQTWAWRGVLLTPVARTETRDLERWLGATPSADAVEPLETTLACWRSQLEPMRVSVISQPLWLLGCSLLVLGIVVGLRQVSLAWSLKLAALCAAAMALACASIVWPSVVPAVLYGCEPGIAVLVFVFLASNLSHWLEQRRSLYLPSFAWANNGSALRKAGSSLNKRREPTTVDAPVKRGSSVLRQQQLQEP